MDAPTLTLPLVLGTCLIVLIVVLAMVLRGQRLREQAGLASGLSGLQSQLEALREQVRSSLEGGRVELDRRLEETNRVVREVRSGLGAVDRQVQNVTDAARDLRGLQELMRSPKIRGGMGETLLSELLAQVLPRSHFGLQHEFSRGERVDAALHVGERIVPVDAKFPLENFRRMRSGSAEDDERARREGRRAFRADVRRHIDAIAKRYIRPDEGTYEFAMMYIPAEAVYQEVLLQEGEDGLDLLHYAMTRQVVPVSPQSFYAYLQVIVLGLKGLTIEERAKEILQRLGRVRNRLDRFSESFEIASRHLGNAQRQTEEAGKRLARLEQALADLTNPQDRPGEQTDAFPRPARDVDSR